MANIILFDGECNFCNHNVLFIIKRDPNAYFKFASLQSSIGIELTEKHLISRHENSLILIEDEKYYSKSTAALKISRKLKPLWNVFYLFILIPKPIRDMVYSIIATNRYKLIHKNKACVIPTADIRRRFLS